MSRTNEPVVLTVETRVERKQVDLPRYAEIPSAAIASWKLEGTTTIGLMIDGVAVESRTVRKWDAQRWFLSITERDCKLLGIDTGSPIVLTLILKSDELPEELASLIREDTAVAAAWARLTPAQQRMLRDEIAAAKQSSTRARRAERALLR
jgi:hypothetical protein